MFETLLLTIKFFKMKLINVEDLLELAIRFSFNLLILFIIIRCIYYPKTKRKEYLFSHFLIAMIIFMLCFLLENVKLQLGFAFGLFAIFSIIRYRTEQLRIKEMTYLFIVIGLSVINALSSKSISFAEIFFTNFSVIITAWILENVFLLKHEARKMINYEKIELIKPENRAKLMEDLETRTGIKINRIEIGRIDFLRDTAKIKIFYYETDNKMDLENDDFIDTSSKDDD
jgi:hypothetical protein